MNGIGQVRFDFTAECEPFVRELYAGWDHFFSVSFERIADEALRQFDHPGKQVLIPELTLDLGEILDVEFPDRFPQKLREAMERELARCLNLTSGTAESEQLSAAEYALQALCDFLLRGTLPWNVAQEHGDVGTLFRTVLESAGARFRSFLYTYGHYTSLRQRLVLQFGDPELEQGVDLLVPIDGRFICTYVRSLRERYEQSERPELTPTVCREVVWEVVYAFLIDRRGSYFNRKSFVQRTLHELAGRFRTDYLQLLGLVAAGLPRLTVGNQSLPELLIILNELQAEQRSETTARFGNLSQWRDLYRVLSGKWKAELDLSNGPAARASLTLILSAETSCRAFVRELDEAAILRLVPIVVPQESSFVIAYARSLDHSRTNGVLEGKTGGEFLRLKWMLIFPVLLERRGTAFSRNYFVMRVLDRIAAHYNLDRIELLAYFARGEAMPQELAALFRQLYEHEYPECELSGKSEPDSIDSWVAYITEEVPLAAAQVGELGRLLSSVRFRTEFLRKIGPEGCPRLVGILSAAHSPFITDYARRLDRSVGQGLLEGRSGGAFRQVKWEFILATLVRQHGSSFNRRTFVGSVLRRTAAHYDLDYADLLFYFYHESGTADLPYGLSDILAALVAEETKVFLRNALRCGDAERFRMIGQLAPHESDAIRTFIRLLEQFQDIWSGSGPRPAFRTLLWRIVLNYLLENRGKLLDMSLFSEIILDRLSLFYRKEKDRAARDFVRRLGAESSAPGISVLKRSLQQFGSPTPLRQPETSASVPATATGIDQMASTSPKIEPDTADPIYIHNAGMVLLSPYLPHLFSRLGLTVQGEFASPEARRRAVFLMQYAVWGQTEFPEYELVLNKLLAEWPSSDPLPTGLELTDEERSLADSMLKGVIANWPRMGSTTAEGLQEGFLQRDGAMVLEADRITLRVESKAYDILLDSLPWKYSPLRFSWMERPIIVEWR